MYLRIPPAGEEAYRELFNTSQTKHKQFIAKLLVNKDALWLAPTFKSLPQELVHDMLIGLLSPYMVYLFYLKLNLV
jgi:hypothetical protein